MHTLTKLAATAALGAFALLGAGVSTAVAQSSMSEPNMAKPMPGMPMKDGPMKATGVQMMAMLTGSEEVPGPGDADGKGMFMGRLNVGQGQLCYTLTSSNLSTLTMAHIHAGKMGVAGPPVVTLMANAPTETCMMVEKDAAQKLVAMTDDFYVNIHTDDFKAGAIRGQLMKH